MKVLAAYHIKGGVGKTSAAVNLAWFAAHEGARTLIWDLDPQGAASYCLRIKPKVKGGGSKLLRGKSELNDLIKATDYNHLDFLPSDFSYRNFDLMLKDAKRPTETLNKTLRSLKGEYDYIFLDCPPSISLLSEAIFCAADALIIPVLPSVLSLRMLATLEKFRKDNKIKKLTMLSFLTMVDRRKKLHKQQVESWLQTGAGALTSIIPYASEVEQMAERREPLACFAPRSRAAQAYAALWSEIEDSIS